MVDRRDGRDVAGTQWAIARDGMSEMNERCQGIMGHEVAEIARLRDEVEWLDTSRDIFVKRLVEVERERDEALAHVAAFIQHLREDDHSYGCRLCGCDLSNPQKSSAEARALLDLRDRLQRAEAVVEAASGLLAFVRARFPDDFKEGGRGFTCPHHQALEKALAAWEKHK